MINVPTSDAKMVEYNTIASSFGILSQKVGDMQHYIKCKYSHLAKQKYEKLNPSESTYAADE
jgi:hypothetical protein